MLPKFYKCSKCNQIIAKVNDTNKIITCCGSPMEELVPGTTDASREKHVPVYHVEGNHVIVEVGSTLHPMSKEHLIEWVVLQTNKGTRRKVLTAQDTPVVSFVLDDDEVVEKALAYCNLHGLWEK